MKNKNNQAQGLLNNDVVIIKYTELDLSKYSKTALKFMFYYLKWVSVSETEGEGSALASIAYDKYDKFYNTLSAWKCESWENIAISRGFTVEEIEAELNKR